MRCTSCSRDLQLGARVDFAFYAHCPHCGTPNFVEAQRSAPARPAPVKAPPRKRSVAKLSHDPLRPADLMRDGVRRGGHWPEYDSGWRYVVSANLTGVLPFLLVENKTHPSSRARSGVAQELGSGLDGAFRAFSTGLDMPKRVFAVEPARVALSYASELHFLEVAPATHTRSALTLAGGDGRELLDLVDPVLEVIDGLVSSGASFADALFDRLGVKSDEAIAPETLERLVDKLTHATHWLAGHVARVGNSIEARLRFQEAGEDLNGSVRVAWQRGDASSTSVTLDAALPDDGPGELEVWAEGSGIVSAVRARLEPRLGDDRLDDALHVSGDVQRAPELTSCRDLCLRLAAVDARVTLKGASLEVRVPSAERGFDDLAAVLDDALRLWRRLALQRRGEGEAARR